MTTVQFLMVLLLASLLGDGGVLRCVRVFVVLCTLRRVMYECFFFLYAKAVLLLFIFLKKQCLMFWNFGECFSIFVWVIVERKSILRLKKITPQEIPNCAIFNIEYLNSN